MSIISILDAEEAISSILIGRGNFGAKSFGAKFLWTKQHSLGSYGLNSTVYTIFRDKRPVRQLAFEVLCDSFAFIP